MSVPWKASSHLLKQNLKMPGESLEILIGGCEPRLLVPDDFAILKAKMSLVVKFGRVLRLFAMKQRGYERIPGIVSNLK